MISLSKKVDLGQDKTRIKDPRDAERQKVTTEEVLKRFFDGKADDKWPLQLLADEVGMGKTFVSLATAFSILEAMSTRAEEDLDGCYQKIVILAPQNSALLGKWTREVGEFVVRCVHRDHQGEAAKAFKSERCERLDDFVRAVRKPGAFAPRVLIAPMALFSGVRLNELHLKQRFILSALFRYWGSSFNRERRERLLKAASEKWPSRPDQVGVFKADEAALLPCSEAEALEEFGRIDRGERRAKGGESSLDGLLVKCREVTEDYQRGREEAFQKLRDALTDLYRQVALSLLNQSFPLVIVDEAHNWKNGPDSGTNGYFSFRDHIASRTRRLLLLTATPFQLRPREMLQLLRIGEGAEITRDAASRERRLKRYRRHTADILRPTLEEVDRCSLRFKRSWAQLRPASTGPLEQSWASPEFKTLRLQLEKMSAEEGLLRRVEVDDLIEGNTRDTDPALRAFSRDALRLFAWNRELTSELGRVVIRHRRNVEHRLFRIGEEFAQDPAQLAQRPDRHVMHAAAGLDVKGEGELPHYLLMRCVSDMYGAGRRTSLGTAMTGCYSTLFESAEGKKLESFAETRPDADQRYRLLRSLVGKRTDPKHPKMASVVDSVVRAWEAGEKSLIFCFRTNTADRLYEILHERIEKVLDEHRRRVLGSEETFKRFRSRLVRREDALIGVLLDRPLWSLARVMPEAFRDVDLRLQDGDLKPLAEVLASFGFDSEEKADRVLVGRAVEHVVARRVRRQVTSTEIEEALGAMADDSWVRRPYGLDGISSELRGTDQDYERSEPKPRAVERLERLLVERRERKEQRAVFDLPAEGESLWFGGAPAGVPERLKTRVETLHRHLTALTLRNGGFDWAGRRKVFEALRRVVTRDAMLIRLLPLRSERQENDWASLLVTNFWEREPEGQRETMAHRIDVFLEGLTSESGSFHEPDSARASSLDATRLGHDRYVALVKGGAQGDRERVFGGFNSPLFPDVLVCTSVGAEGIDLHRYCRHVIHYDLAWNPAVLEQRTGRIDRIGSKTFRERALAGERFLEVGVPYLAGTYDERMFEELRMRAQVFEVMTGGDVSSDDAGGSDEVAAAEGVSSEKRFTVLPEAIVEDLRVRLSVWAD
ncbi:MAG: helicase-related protein [Planctomycetota bacterium]|nr:helicase-related protein [Planctomycetota bacterium]